MLGVAAQTVGAAIESVNTSLGFPPAAAFGHAACLSTLPATQFPFGLVVSLWVGPGLALAVRRVGVYAGVYSPVGNPGFGFLW